MAKKKKPIPRPARGKLTGARLHHKATGRVKTYANDEARILDHAISKVDDRLSDLVYSDVEWTEEKVKELRGRFQRLANTMNAAKREGGRRPARRKKGVAARRRFRLFRVA